MEHCKNCAFGHRHFVTVKTHIRLFLKKWSLEQVYSHQKQDRIILFKASIALFGSIKFYRIAVFCKNARQELQIRRGKGNNSETVLISKWKHLLWPLIRTISAIIGVTVLFILKNMERYPEIIDYPLLFGTLQNREL